MKAIFRFFGELFFAFIADIFFLILFKRPFTFFVSMLFIKEMLREQQNWRVMLPILLVNLSLNLIVVGSMGIGAVYLIPLALLAKKSRELMHFSRAFFVAFIVLCFFLQQAAFAYLVGSLPTVNLYDAVFILLNSLIFFVAIAD